ncbi:ribosome biogenesis GTP-binding protein YihA/YsxC [uncultured Desulfovibrio sp.]|uniref:ribosome biogenesis GTP-binding protein YihA/YsxC n=1 Tax=uncultured Desulfovibrio sp. TaxID=167968 RepID=UPI00261F3270|nr:ribosome biogenesis GTP-binding protein YihA/YsxC [uncultured Desulfovibrio sp.]
MNPVLTLETTAYTLEQLISLPVAQIALAGRSNVGKSSLINALAGRKKLAKVSSTPGKTRSVNYYHVTPHDFYLVDLPGYGYARASHTEREKWARLLERYLVECTSLKALALLLDSRLEPQKLDKNLASFARTNGLNIVPVLTKADKCSQRERANRQNEWQELLGTRPIVTSSSNRYGIDNLWRALVETAVPQRLAPGALNAADAEAEPHDGAIAEQEPQEQAENQN